MDINLTVPHVYTAIAEITGKLAKVGIGKDRKNEAQGYKFRGIDDVYNALSALLAEHKLCVIPRVLSRTVSERVSIKRGQNGKEYESTLFYVVVEVDFDLVSAMDGSRHTAHVVGEAMDSGDKATNKAMSAAYKYLAMQVFCIPTEGDNDADATTHENIRPAVDTKKVNAYAKAMGEAQDDQDKLWSIWCEVKEDHDFAGAVWASLSRAMKNRVLDAKEAKEVKAA